MVVISSTTSPCGILVSHDGKFLICQVKCNIGHVAILWMVWKWSGEAVHAFRFLIENEGSGLRSTVTLWHVSFVFILLLLGHVSTTLLDPSSVCSHSLPPPSSQQPLVVWFILLQLVQYFDWVLGKEHCLAAKADSMALAPFVMFLNNCSMMSSDITDLCVLLWNWVSLFWASHDSHHWENWGVVKDVNESDLQVLPCLYFLFYMKNHEKWGFIYLLWSNHDIYIWVNYFIRNSIKLLWWLDHKKTWIAHRNLFFSWF